MKTFTIDSANNITAFASEKDAANIEGTERFGSPEELQQIAANWPAARLVEIWNSIPGFTPVKKFTDRKTAVARIWKAVQSLGGSDGSDAVQPKQAKSGKKSGPAKRPAEKSGKLRSRAKRKPAAAREGSKKAEVLALLQQPKGATLRDLMKATGWQAHSVRGFISGTLGKKMRLQVQSTKTDDGERVYKIAR